MSCRAACGGRFDAAILGRRGAGGRRASRLPDVRQAQGALIPSKGAGESPKLSRGQTGTPRTEPPGDGRLASNCGFSARSDGSSGCRADDGIALVAALLALAFVAAIGLGLVLTVSLEPVAAANHESAWAARFGAEAAISVAAHELAAASAWDGVLAGTVPSSRLNAPTAAVVLPDGTTASTAALTNQALCGHAEPCSRAETVAMTTDRPWGPNNPAWRAFGVLRLEPGRAAVPGGPPVTVVVWVGDDPAEMDGDPLHDTRPSADGSRGPGACAVCIRAEAFSVRGGHRVMTALLTRTGHACAGPARLAGWRELR
jgi:hypothetical protein